ncbi:MAG: hypothetical protein IIC67_01110 [Thaumarchaeota archaeon]|nr:hypothetical protein [Nitrososphaerota archaeon]
MIKLETDSIRSLQNLNNFLEDIRKNSLDFYFKCTDHIATLSSNASHNPNILHEITIQLDNIAKHFQLNYPKVMKKLDGIEKDIEWIEFNKKIE